MTENDDYPPVFGIIFNSIVSYESLRRGVLQTVHILFSKICRKFSINFSNLGTIPGLTNGTETLSGHQNYHGQVERVM